MLLFSDPVNLRHLGNTSSEAVITISPNTFQLAANQRLSFDQPILTVIAERLQPAHPAALFNQVAPRIVGIFLIPPLLDPVVFHVIKLTGVEVQPVRRRVVSELLTVHQLARVTAVQLAVGFVLVLDLAAQFVEGADEFAGRVVLMTAMDRVVGVLHQQFGLNTWIVDLRKFLRRQG